MLRGMRGPAARVLIFLIPGWMSVCCAGAAPGLEEAAVSEPRCITIHTDDVVHRRFGGVGFHVYHHVFDSTKRHLDEVLAKRWRELNPSFARMNDKWDWDRATLDKVAEHILRLKATGTEVYVTTWNPRDTKAGADRAVYAKRVVDNLEYLVRRRGCTNIRTYCMTNELSLGRWGVLRRDLPKFRDYHRELFAELRRRKLDIRLLATDASPVGRWDTIDWAAENMDDLTGVYGGHHYVNKHALDDPKFYGWFRSQVARAAGVARRCGKDFILGEFGCKQDGRVIGGVKMDRCVYWDTPQEPLVALQLAEAALAAINGGAYAMGCWTFSDFPDPAPGRKYMNKWGTFRWSGTDYRTRDHYYAYGLLTKFFRGPAIVLRTEAADALLRVAAVRHHGAKTWSIAIVNRGGAPARVRVGWVSAEARAIRGAAFRKYVYDPRHVPQHRFGDLQAPAGTVALRNGHLEDTLAAGTLTVYTTAYDDRPPEAVRDLRARRTPDGKVRLTWSPSPEPDLCYYRVFRSHKADFAPGVGTQIGSTVAAEFVDDAAPARAKAHYAVLAVDQSGNAGGAAKASPR